MSELEESGFIRSMVPYEHATKDAVYRLIGEYSIFYLKFMDRRRPAEKDVWLKNKYRQFLQNMVRNGF